MRAASLRRAAVFLILAGGGMAAIHWVAGGFVAETPTSTGAGPEDDLDAEEGAHRVRSAGVGSGRGGHYAVIEPVQVDGREVLYTRWEARWTVAHPRESDDPENPDIDAEGVSMRFSPPPTAERPEVTAGAGPGVLEIDADRAHIEKRGSAGRMRTELSGDVFVTRHDLAEESGAFTLATEALTIQQIDDEHQSFESAEHVVMRQPGAAIEGDGMSGNTRDGFFELLENVKGRLETATGTVRLSCQGTGRLELLDSREGVAAEQRRRRRFVFRDHARIEDGKNVITCTESLWVEVPKVAAAKDATRGPLANIAAFEAIGDFVLAGESRRGPYRITANEARHHQERVERTRKWEIRDVLVLEGAPQMEFVGAIGRDRPGPNADRPTRTIIACRGPATLTSRPRHEVEFAGVRRFDLVFVDQVVMRQIDVETGEQIALLEAPKVTLFGNQYGDGTFEPEHLTAEDGAHVVHGAFDARSRVVTWMENHETGGRRVILGGNPQVTFTGKSDLNPFGGSGRGEPGTLLLTARGDIDIHLAPEAVADSDPGAAGSLTVKASRDVHVRKVVGETEPYHLQADELEAVFDQDRRLRVASAYGHARMVGRAEDQSGRRGEASGAKIIVRSAAGARHAEDLSSALILGSYERKATAIVHDEGGRVHRIRAQSIRYQEGGSVVLAKGTAQAPAEAALSLPAQLVQSLTATDPVPRGSALKIFAQELRAELRGSDAEAGDSRPQLLRLVATDQVLMQTTKEEVSGERVEYDAVQGVADAQGRPARVTITENTARRKRAKLPALQSFVLSDHIRAVLSTDAGGRPELIRASCNGGRIQRYMLPTKEGDGRLAKRVRVESAGPITVDRRQASVREDVAVIYESELPGGAWERAAKVLCNELDMTFQEQSGTAKAKDGLQNRIAGMVAVGSAELRIRLITERIDATADRMETLGDGVLIHLTADPGRFVEVHDKTEGYRWRCDPGCSVDYETYEWRAHGRSELLAD